MRPATDLKDAHDLAGTRGSGHAERFSTLGHRPYIKSVRLASWLTEHVRQAGQRRFVSIQNQTAAVCVRALPAKPYHASTSQRSSGTWRCGSVLRSTVTRRPSSPAAARKRFHSGRSLPASDAQRRNSGKMQVFSTAPDKHDRCRRPASKRILRAPEVFRLVPRER